MKRLYTRIACLTLALLMLASPGITEAFTLNSAANLTAAISTLEAMKAETDALEVTGCRSWKRKVKLMDWYHGGSSVLRLDGYGYIYDIKTGITLRVKRCGGTSHADLEPATKKDTYKLWKLDHGFSWDRRPVILFCHGKYVAASINTKPHGKQTIRSNGFKGQFCLHMLNSRTHGSKRVDGDHMSCVRQAYNWAH